MRLAALIIALIVVLGAGGGNVIRDRVLEAGDAVDRHSDAQTTGCKRTTATVKFSRSKYPNIVKHIEDSWKYGYPKVGRINRDGADERRDRLLDDYQERHPQPKGDGLDLDEAPAAVLRSRWRAHVRPIPQRENRSAGSSLGSQLRGFCDGARVVYRFEP